VRAPFVATLVLTVTLACACFGAVMAVVMAVVQPTPIAGFGVGQRQDAETALYLAGFFLILPAAVAGAPRVADAIARGPNRAVLSSLVAILAGSLALGVILVRLSSVVAGGGGKAALLGMLVVWGTLAGVLLWRASSAAAAIPLAATLSECASLLWAATGVLVFGVLLTVTDLGSLAPVVLALGALAVAATLAAWGHVGLRPPRREVQLALDVLVVVLVCMVAVDLVVLTPEDPNPSFLERLSADVMQFHHDLLLGPANQILGGQAMLVDTASQYGVGSIDFLAGWFHLVPIGYGGMALLDGLLTALMFAAGYALLRLAGVPLLLAGASIATAVIVLVLARAYPVGVLPQDGPFRFGWPLFLTVAAVAAERWPRRASPLNGLAFATLAVTSVWALEAFALTAATFAVIAGVRAWLSPPGGRLPGLLRQLAIAVAACVAAHVVFAGATLAATGELPDWSQYFAFLDAFLFGDLGNLTYDFVRWSPALAVGAAYMGSAAALALLVPRRSTDAAERPALVALAGTTACGIFEFSYFVDRSAPHVLAYVSLPLLLTGTLWLSLILRRRSTLPPALSRAALAFAVALATLVVAAAWDRAGDRVGHTALAHLVPGGRDTVDAVDRLVHFPAIDAAAISGERVLERELPGERRSVVLAQPNLATETLMRSGRANELPLADAWEDSFVAQDRAPAVRNAVDSLQPGRRVLFDRGMLLALAAVRANPNIDLSRPTVQGSPVAPLQLVALEELDRRFRLRAIRRGGDGWTVVELWRRA